MSMERLAVAGPERRRQEDLRVLRRASSVEKTQSPTDAEDVGVHRKRRSAQSEQQDAGGHHAADTPEPTQVGADLLVRHVPKKAEVEVALLPPDLLQQRLDVYRLDARQPTRADDRNHVLEGCSADGLPGSETAAQIRIRPLAVRGGGALRQQRMNQGIQRVVPAARWLARSVGPTETGRDLGKLTGRWHRYLDAGTGGTLAKGPGKVNAKHRKVRRAAHGLYFTAAALYSPVVASRIE
jgi:hypothetical protein